MAFNLRNRSFVKLLDFTPAEIKFLLKLSADRRTLSPQSTAVTSSSASTVRMSPSSLRNPPPAPAHLLKWRHTTKGPM